MYRRTGALVILALTAVLSDAGGRRSQAQSCSYTVTPTAIGVSEVGNSGLVSVVTSGSSCGWTANSDAAWATTGAPTYGSVGQVLKDGAVGYWRLGESSGTSAADRSGHGLTGTAMSSGVTWQQSGALADGDTAAYFDGAAGGITVAGPAVNFTTAMSAEAWVKTTSNAFQTVVDKGMGGHQEAWGLFIDQGHLRVEMVNTELDASDSVAVFVGTTAVADGQWHHVAATWNGGTARFYVDGALEGTNSLNGTLLTNNAAVVIGHYPGWGLRFQGALDEIAVYDHALSATQVAQHYGLRTSDGLSGSGVVSYSVASNSSTSLRTATLTIAGQAVDVTQAAAGTCDAGVTPGSLSVGANGATGDVAVAINSACQWSAVSDATWATVALPTFGYASRVLADAAVSYWRFNEPSGTTAADRTGHGYNATASGLVWQQPGALADGDSAARFNFWTSSASVANAAAFNFTSALTAEVWVQTTYTSQWQVIISKGLNGASWEVWLTPQNGRPYFSLYTSTGFHDFYGTTSLTDGAWHHVVATWDGATAKLIVDGVLDTQQSIGGTLATVTDGISIGHQGGYGFHGQLDDLAIYGQSFTESQAAQHVALRTTALPSGSGSVAYAIQPNTSAGSRSATLTIAGRTVAVSQAAAGCSYSVSPSTLAPPSAGQSGLITVTANGSTCGWTASSDASWVTLGSPVFGYVSQVLADGAAGYWRLGESSGTSVADRSGRGLAGTATSGVTWQQSSPLADGDTAAYFDGVTGGITVPASAVNFTTGMTAEAWVKTTSTAFQTLVDKGTGGGASGETWGLFLENGKARLELVSSPESVHVLQGTQAVADGQWHHVVGTWNGSAFTLYVDGALDATATLGGTLIANTQSILIGHYPGWGLRAIGTLDDVAVYDHALSATQIALHYALRTDPATSGSGVVTYSVAPNGVTSSRTTALHISGATVPVAQAGVQQPYSVAAGSAHALALKNDGTVWTWGTNGNGQLGDGTSTPRVTPIPVSSLSSVAAIAAGSNSSYALKTDGTVWSWGANDQGQLADGTLVSKTSPVSVSGLTNVVAIAAGANHALALKSDHTLWSWGYNGYGQLGDGTTVAKNTPVQVTALGGSVRAIAAAGNHSVAVKTDGTVWAWGDNANGDTGDGTTTSPRTTPVQTQSLTNQAAVGAAADQSFAWNDAGTLMGWGYDADGEVGDTTTAFRRLTPVSVSGLSAVIAMHGGNAHSIAATSDGAVWGWGLSNTGQVGDGTTTTHTAPVQIPGVSAVSVSAGAYFSIAVSSDGRVWSWGDNYYGQLGDGTFAQRNAPVQLSDENFNWRVATPTLSPNGGTFTSNVGVTVATVAAGATIHYTTNGVEPTEADATVANGGIVTVTQTTTLKARAWVSGAAPSNIASATFTLNATTPVLSPGTGIYTSAQSVTMTTSTSGATIRYTTDGSAPTASSTAYSGSLSISTGTTVKAAAFKTGWTTSAAATETYAFNYGTLAAPVFTPTPSQIGYGSQVSISAAAFATIRYTTNGSTPTASSPIYTGPITVTGTVTILAKAFHVDWTTSAQSGGAYTVKVSAPVFSPGAGTYAPGQLVTITNATPGAVIHYTTNGADPTANDPVIASGATVVAGNYTLKAQGFQTGWTSSDIASAGYALSGSFTNWAVAAGNNHTVGLKNDGTVWTWGSNGDGALGDTSGGRSMAAVVNGVTGVVAVSAGVGHTLVLRSDGSVWAWGSNPYGALGDNTTTSRSSFAPVDSLSSVTAIAAGSYFSAALKSDGTVWAWGDNSYGQLGDGTRTQRHVATQVNGLTGVAAIAAGDTHMVVRKTDGTLWAWGSNGLGELGDGTTTLRMSPVQVSSLTASAGPWVGNAYSLAATADGSLYAWGWNSAGQLGTGGAGGPTPALVAGLTNVTAADGSSFSIARTSDGTVWTFGKNGNGQIGDGTTINRTTPYQVSSPIDVAAVAAGLNHSVIVTADGSVWAWGYNGSGQLGDGTLDDRLIPVQISEAGFNWKTSTPRLSPYGGGYSAATSVTVTAVTPAAEIHYTTTGVDPTQSDATVASGGTVTVDQSLTLKARAWAAGMPSSNVAAADFTMTLPLPTVSPATGTYLTTQTVTMSSAMAGATTRYTIDGSDPTTSSPTYSSALTVDTTTTIKAKSFKAGWTDSGITTRIYTLKVVPPTFSPSGGSYGSAQTVAISTTTPSTTIRYTLNGTEPTATSAVYSSPVTVSATSTVKAIASRTGWATSDSAAASFWITQGTVATPTFSPTGGTYSPTMFVIIASTTSGATIRYTVDGSDPTPASAPYQWPIGLTASTVVKARAYKDSFTPSAAASASYALDVAGAVDTPAIVPAGGFFAAGLTAAVSVQASGATLHYTTNGVDPVATDPVVPSGGVVVDRSMVVKVKGWSASATPSAVRRADFIVTGTVTGSERSSHALKADGTVWSWGANDYGQLGDGTYLQRASPVATGLSGVVGIASATYHTLAVKADGTIWSWGYNGDFELGDTGATRNTPAQVPGLTNMRFIAVAAGETHSLALRDDGTVWTWGGNTSGQLGDGTMTGHAAPAMIAGLTGVTRIAAGRNFSLAIETDGTGGGRIWTWGDNAAGQLGDGSRITRVRPVQVNAIANAIAIAGGWDSSFAATVDGAVWAWGANGSGQLGDGTNTDRLGPVPVLPLAGAFALSAGRLHAVAITNDGRAWAWGSDAYGQLADGSDLDHNYPQPVQVVNGALAIAAGQFYTLAVQADGTIKGWGMNSSGQLGDGSTTQRPVPVSGLSLANNAWLLGDQDQDSLLTWLEYLTGTDPLNADTSGSGLGDRVLKASGKKAPSTDLDGDGVSNADELKLGTDPFSADTDGDGVPDGQDAFPLDPTRSQPLASNPNDHVPPIITLIEPRNAVRIQ